MRGSHVRDKRPVNLDIATIRLPVAAYASILHRASGVFNFAGIAVLLWVLERSLAGPASFAALQEQLQSPLAKFVIWTVLAGLIYHTVAGVKHLIQDLGIGETLEGGRLAAQITLAIAAAGMVLAGVWLW